MTSASNTRSAAGGTSKELAQWDWVLPHCDEKDEAESDAMHWLMKEQSVYGLALEHPT